MDRLCCTRGSDHPRLTVMIEDGVFVFRKYGASFIESSPALVSLCRELPAACDTARSTHIQPSTAPHGPAGELHGELRG